MVKNNSFAYQFYMAIYLIFSFIKNNISNICLGLAALLILFVLNSMYGVNTMLLGLSAELLLVSVTTSLPKKEEKSNAKQRYY